MLNGEIYDEEVDISSTEFYNKVRGDSATEDAKIWFAKRRI